MKPTNLSIVTSTSVCLAFAILRATASEGASVSTAPAERMILVKMELARELVLPSPRGDTVILPEAGTNATVPVELVARTYEFRTTRGTNTNWPLELVEFGVNASEARPFGWYCWDSANSHPHDLKLFATQGGTYACYTSSHGVKIFRLSANIDSNSARSLFVEQQRGSGEITPLSNAVLRDSVGAEPFYGLNALYWTIVVDLVSEVNGEARVTLHGDKSLPKYTFRLKGEHWELLSTAGQ